MVEFIGVSDTLHLYSYACSHGPADDLKRAATHDPATHGAATHDPSFLFTELQHMTSTLQIVFLASPRLGTKGTDLRDGFKGRIY